MTAITYNYNHRTIFFVDDLYLFLGTVKRHVKIWGGLIGGIILLIVLIGFLFIISPLVLLFMFYVNHQLRLEIKKMIGLGNSLAFTCEESDINEIITYQKELEKRALLARDLLKLHSQSLLFNKFLLIQHFQLLDELDKEVRKITYLPSSGYTEAEFEFMRQNRPSWVDMADAEEEAEYVKLYRQSVHG